VKVRRPPALALVTVLAVAPVVSAQGPVAAQVSREQFASLRWLVGSWHGSGGNFPSFFERYRMVDDSTMVMESATDSTFAAIDESQRFEWRGGVLRQVRNGATGSVLVGWHVDSLRWASPRGSGNGTLYVREGADRWHAVLYRNGEPFVTYALRRIGG
jgi:hypothetical protein